MGFYFIGVILPKVCKTEFSNAWYNIFSRIELGYEIFSEFLALCLEKSLP